MDRGRTARQPRAGRLSWAACVVLVALAQGCLDWTREERDALVTDGGVDVDATVDVVVDQPKGDLYVTPPDGGDLHVNLLGPLGWPCDGDEICYTGHCADGVCCNVSCGGACEACNIGGVVGICTVIPAGYAPPPGKSCEASGGCGTDGTCDGAGHCRNAPGGTVCQPASCDGDEVVVAHLCDGLGNCAPALAEPIACAPYSCDAARGACFDSCGASAEACASGESCVDGRCAGADKPLGAPCDGDGECISSYCADGVCCAEACGQPCRTCSTPGAAGACLPVPLGQLPRKGSCSTSPPCGADGRCDGAGGCRQQTPEGTPCAEQDCDSGVLRRSFCDEDGVCDAALSDCAPYVCLPGVPACYGRCTADPACAEGTCNTATHLCE